MKRKTKVINLFAGPGGGKTATGLELAGLMKKIGMSCEYAPEAVKSHVWDNNQRALSCQPKIFGDQLNELHKLDGKCDFIVTDSPLTINLLHNGFGVTQNYKNWIVEIFNMFDNINILITVDRETHKYEESGRYESKERAAEMDIENNKMLIENNIPFVVFKLHENTAQNICNYIRATYTSDGKNLRTEEQEKELVASINKIHKQKWNI